MSDPASSAAGAVAGAAAGHKAFLLGLPIAISILAFALGMRIVPLRKGREMRDMMDRLLACGVSTFVVGLPVLVAILNHFPWMFSGATELASRAGTEPVVGFFAIVGCVMLVCSLPGPWLLVAYLRWFERRRGKDLGELAGDAGRDIRRAIDGEDSSRGGLL
jgi:hypothetical protein